VKPTPTIIKLMESDDERERTRALSIANSRADVDALDQPLTAGVPEPLTITAYDGGGDVMVCGGVSWRVALTGPTDVDPSLQRTTLATVVDNQDGTYTAKLVALEAGEFALDIRPAGAPLDSAEFAVPLANPTVIGQGERDRCRSV
jgi:hypothetical protein